MVIKASLSQGQQYHVIHTEVLGPSTRVSQMKLSQEGSVYLATDNGVYGLSVANCSVYTDCCSCVAAKDPFCAFDTSVGECVLVSSVSNTNLAQSVSTGSSSLCACEEVTSEPTTTTETTTMGCTQQTIQSPTDVTPPGLGT